jgi:uncharacterized membrane protein
MKKLSRWLYTTYHNLINSIAFYPVLIAFGFFVFSFIVMYLEYKPFIIDFKKWISPLLVGDKADARLILGTVIGSIFSLMVFSFSMVMLVLNSASSALSPRVIPGLITKKSHQVVLGYYIGTIVYCFILIINIQGETADFQIPTLGVLLAMSFAMYCLVLFVYFIHSISKSIQVDTILDRIFRQSSAQLDAIEESDEEFEIPDTENWHSVYSNEDGYLKRINRSELLRVFSL